MRRIRFSAVLAWSLLLTCTAAKGADNLIVNPGFEGQVAGEGVPDGWAFTWKSTHSNDDPAKVKKERPDFALDESVRHSGAHSVRMGVRRPQDDALLRQIVKNLPTGKKFYRVKAWIKTANISGGDARITAAFYSADGKWLSANYNLICVSQPEDWTLHVALFPLPEGAADIRIALWVNFQYTGAATAWADDLSLEATDLKEIPPTLYVDETPMSPLSPQEQARGYVAFKTNYLDMVFHETVPTRETIDAPLRAFASPGEYEPVTFAVRALKDLGDVKITVDPFSLHASRSTLHDIDVRSVRFLPKKPHYSIMEWMSVPAFLEKREALTIPANMTQPFWITIHAPADAPPGLYQGRVQISPSKAEPLSLPIEFEILPIKLEQPKGVAFGMYDNDKWYGDDLDGLYKKYADMREHGMTSVGFCGGIGGKVAFENGKANIEWDDTKGLGLAMKCYLRAGFTEPFHWLMGGTTGLALKQGALESPQFETAYRSMIEAILERAKRDHWPEIIWQPEDEAFEHRPNWPRMMRTVQILKKIPGIRTEADGMNGNPDGLEDALPFLDVLNYHDGPHLVRRIYDGPGWEHFMDRLERGGKQVWFYNIDTTGYHPEIMRFGYGYHLIRCRAKGAFCWAYQWGDKDPYVDPPKGFSFMFNYPPVDGETGGPSAGWEGTREGVDDYRYYAAYLKAAETARASGNPKEIKIVSATDAALKEALAKIEYGNWKQPGHQGLWTGGPSTSLRAALSLSKGGEHADENGVKTCSGNYKLPNGWDFNEYDRLRRLLAQAIVKLQE